MELVPEALLENSATAKSPSTADKIAAPKLEDMNAATTDRIHRSSNRQPLSWLLSCFGSESRSWWRRKLFNSDPLIFKVLLLSSAVMLMGLAFVVYQNHQLTERHLQQLAVTNTELIEKLAAISTLDETGFQQAEISDQPMVQTQNISGDEATKNTLSEPVAIARHEVSTPELELLQSRLFTLSQQVEFLAQENHELRLLAEIDQSIKHNAGSEESIRDHLDNNQLADNRTLSTSATVTIPDAKITESRSLKIFLDKGNSALQKQDYQSAAVWFSEALQYDPYSRAANIGVASVALVQGNKALAVDRYRHLLSLDPDDVEVFESMLELSLAGNMIETELLNHLSQSARQPAVLHSIMGLYYAESGRWARSNEQFHAAIAATPAPVPPDYLFNLAISFEHLGYRAAAREHYLQALHSPADSHLDRQLLLSRIDALEHLR